MKNFKPGFFADVPESCDTQQKQREALITLENLEASTGEHVHWLGMKGVHEDRTKVHSKSERDEITF